MQFSTFLCRITPLAFACVLVFAGSTEHAAWAQEVNVQDVQAYQQGNRVVITYSLLGPDDAEYEVALRVSNDNGRSYQIEPNAVSGAVGDHIEPGREKEIVWQVLDDFPRGIEGDDYRFKVIGRNVGTSTFGLGAVASGGFGNQIGTVCCAVGGRILWNLRGYPVDLSLNIEFWRRERVNKLSTRINYMYNDKILDVGIYNTISFGELNVYRAGLVIDTAINVYSIEFSPSIRYPMYISILNGNFSEFSLDRYAIVGTSITIRF